MLISVTRLNFGGDNQPNRHAFHDIGLAVANLIVQAMTMGPFAHQMAGFFLEKVKKLYAFPAEHELVTAITLGYPSFIFEGRWGQRSKLV